MLAQYRRDTHHSYLVLYETDRNSRESFQTRMFLENDIPGFLPCRKVDIDCSGRFFYDISARQSLVTLLETRSLDGQKLENLLVSVLQALDGLQGFLLDTGGFCLNPEWIFGDPSWSFFEFCYFPDGDLNWKEQLQQLAEYILPRLEHKNREAVQLGYDFYQYVMEDKITASELKLLLKNTQEKTDGIGEEEEKQSSARGSERSDTERAGIEEIPSNRDELLNAFFDEEKTKEEKNHVFPEKLFFFLEWMLPLLTGGIGMSAFCFFGYYGAAFICAGFAVAVLFCLLFQRWKKSREKERDATMEQYVVVQDWLEEEKQEEYLLQNSNYTDTTRPENAEPEEGATCLLASEEVYRRLANGYLVPLSATDGETVVINKEKTMIGKSSHMDVVLKGMGISRIHARISCREEQCFLTDMNSRNGTSLNGVLLKPQEEQILSNGDRIRFANAEYEWHCYRL